jgi:hypothetical protein
VCSPGTYCAPFNRFAQNLSFFAEVTVRFDDIAGGSWQRIFDYGNGPASNNILITQEASSSRLVVHVYNGASAAAVITASSALVQGEVATWTLTINSTGYTQLFKNGVSQGAVQGIVPPNVVRVNQFVGRSNWVVDTPLIGEVSALEIIFNPLPLRCPLGSAISTQGVICASPQPGTANFTICPAGSFCPEGASAPTECPAGYFCVAGSAAPSECSQGTYCTAGSAVPKVFT